MTAWALTAPMPLIPTTATFTRSLGAWKPRPRTWRGTIVRPAAVAATLVMNSRRVDIWGPQVKSQVPSSKSQRTPKSQDPNQFPNQPPNLSLGHWELGGHWDLELGAWDLSRIQSLSPPCELPRLRVR